MRNNLVSESYNCRLTTPNQRQRVNKQTSKQANKTKKKKKKSEPKGITGQSNYPRPAVVEELAAHPMGC